MKEIDLEVLLVISINFNIVVDRLVLLLSIYSCMFLCFFFSLSICLLSCAFLFLPNFSLSLSLSLSLSFYLFVSVCLSLSLSLSISFSLQFHSLYFRLIDLFIYLTLSFSSLTVYLYIIFFFTHSIIIFFSPFVSLLNWVLCIFPKIILLGICISSNLIVSFL